jgi:hypothetical protein
VSDATNEAKDEAAERRALRAAAAAQATYLLSIRTQAV